MNPSLFFVTGFGVELSFGPSEEDVGGETLFGGSIAGIEFGG